MNYGQVKEQTLKLLNQYTIAGSEVAPGYNNQQDYLNKIPALVDDAIMEISTTVRKIHAMVRLDELYGEDIGSEVIYSLPQNFYQIVSGGVKKVIDGKLESTNDYKLSGNRIIVPKETSSEYRVEYYRYPMGLASNPKNSDELDNDPVVHRAVPYYVASTLLASEEPYLSSLYGNKYEERKAMMAPAITADICQVDDVYSLGVSG